MSALTWPHQRLMVLGAANGLGGVDHGPALGPTVLYQAGVLALLAACGWNVVPQWLAPPSLAGREAALGVFGQRLAKLAAISAIEGLPLLLGGDHSSAAGFWRGLQTVLPPFGLIWLDAHLDAHTSKDSQSHNPHGMPLAAILGEGSPFLTDMGVSLPPKRVCVLGARSWEVSEQRRLKRLGVEIIPAAAIHKIGLSTALAHARKIVGVPFGISLDVDVLDPGEAPAVGTPVGAGLHSTPLIAAMRGWGRLPACIGVELAEFNPPYDQQHQTLDLLLTWLQALFSDEAVVQPSTASRAH